VLVRVLAHERQSIDEAKPAMGVEKSL
ncbi:MAG: hypothetical protein OJF50_006379, partial [Nitrospira sp.]|nr:hypothetical protein [Nitrospira sp.]